MENTEHTTWECSFCRSINKYETNPYQCPSCLRQPPTEYDTENAYIAEKKSFWRINVDDKMQKMVIEGFIKSVINSNIIIDCIIQLCLLYLSHQNFLIIYEREDESNLKYGTFYFINFNNKHQQMIKIMDHTNLNTNIEKTYGFAAELKLSHSLYIPNYQIPISLLSNNNNINPLYSYDTLISPQQDEIKYFVMEQHQKRLVDIVTSPYKLPKRSYLYAYSTQKNGLIAIQTREDIRKEDQMNNQNSFDSYRFGRYPTSRRTLKIFCLNIDNNEVEWKLLYTKPKHLYHDFDGLFKPLMINYDHNEYILFGEATYGSSNISLYNLNNDTMQKCAPLSRGRRSTGVCFNRVYEECYVIGGTESGGGCLPRSFLWSDCFNIRKNKWTKLPDTNDYYSPALTWIDYTFSPNVLFAMRNSCSTSYCFSPMKIGDVEFLDLRNSEKRTWQNCPPERQINNIINYGCKLGRMIHTVTSSPWSFLV